MNPVLSTTTVHPLDRLSFWNEAISNTFVPCVIDTLDNHPFQGTVQTQRLDFVQFSLVSATRSYVRRTRRIISRITDAYVKVLYQVSGESVLVQNGRSAYLRPGSWCIGDCSTPYDLILPIDNVKHLVVYLPHKVLTPRLNDLTPFTAHAFSSLSGLGKVTLDFVQSTLCEIDNIEPEVAPRLAGTLLDLLITDLRETFQLSRASMRNGAVTVAEIKAFIQEQIANPDLSVDLIANALHLSKGYVHFLFQMEESTVSRYIWDLRLEKCRTALADAAQAHRSISDIAYAWGFNGLSHFSHSFKSRYGCSPREYRTELLEAKGLTVNS